MKKITPENCRQLRKNWRARQINPMKRDIYRMALRNIQAAAADGFSSIDLVFESYRENNHAEKIIHSDLKKMLEKRGFTVFTGMKEYEGRPIIPVLNIGWPAH